jgi:hypothetical protein
LPLQLPLSLDNFVDGERHLRQRLEIRMDPIASSKPWQV